MNFSFHFLFLLFLHNFFAALFILSSFENQEKGKYISKGRQGNIVERTKIISFKSLLYLNALVLTILDLFGVLVWLWCEFQKYLITFKKNVDDLNDFHIIKSLFLPLSKLEAISIDAAYCFYPVSDMTYPIKTQDLSLM